MQWIVLPLYAFSAQNVTVNDAPSLQWVKEEKNAYFFQGTKTIYYGCLGSASKTGGTYCNADAFGGASSDPCLHVGKHCWYFDDDNLVKCADEHGSCFFSDTKTIYYGALTWKDQTNGTICDDDVFGDPAPHVEKNCYIRSDQK